MDNLPQFTPWTITLTIAFFVVILKAIVSHFVNHSSLSFFSFYCDQLAKKVNKPTNSYTQQKISGGLAIFITLAPLVIILWLFEDFVAVNWLWQALLLYLSIGGIGLFKVSKLIVKDLRANKKTQAKALISSHILRQHQTLSPLGISKANVEMQLLLIGQQLICVLFYFIIAGPLAALSYRLLLEMHYSWNIKLSQFKYFGSPISKLINILQWLPMRCYTIALLFSTLGQNLLINWQKTRKDFFRLNNNILINTLALSLNCKLGGAAIYQDKKIQRSVFNPAGKQPEITDMLRASARIKYALLFLSSALFLITIAQIILHR